MGSVLRKLLRYVPEWVPTGVTLAAVLWLTLAPHPVGDREIHLFEGADKIVHAVMFGTLTLAALIDWQRARNWQKLRTRQVLSVFLSVSALGIGIEFIQHAMGLGRSFEIADIAADTIGALIAASIYVCKANKTL